MEVAGGLTLLLPFSDDPTELFGQYAGQLYFKTKSAELITGITGRILITDPDLSFGRRSTHQIGFSAIGVFGSVRPGVMVRLAIDEPLRSRINAVLGFSLSYEIRPSRRQ